VDLSRLIRDRRGAVAPTTALSLVAVLGFAGLGIDVGYGYLQRRSAQHAADSAAFSGAVALNQGTTDAAAQARAVAARYGFEPAKVTVNLPPVSGPNAGQAGAVEVLVERPGRRFFSALLGAGGGVIRARAVGKVGRDGDACVLALHATASAAAQESGTADVVLNGCSLFANSSSQSALELKGGARLTAKSVGLVGGYSLSSNSVANIAEGIATGQSAISDPYANVEPPPYGSQCDGGGDLPTGEYGRIDGQPTVWCNGIRINNGSVVKLRPGVHILDRGALTVNGGATLTGDGVTIILTSRTGSNYATLGINGGAYVQLSAPTSGPYSGLAIFQDRRAPSGINNTLNGGSTQDIQGAIYFPTQKVSFTGGASATTGCTQLLASEISFTGNSRLGLNCQGRGVRSIGGQPPKLVE